MVSVIIPTHNRADLLPRAVESVLRQTYADFEILIVSDGSTDETDRIAKEFCEKDGRVHFFSYFPAKGGNRARNFGISEAKGDILAFLDDDDEWKKDKLQKQVDLLNGDPSVGLVYTGAHILYVNEKVEYRSVGTKSGDLSREILLENVIGTTSTVAVRREVLEKAGSFDEELSALQDFDLWIRCAQVTKIGLVPEELISYYNYRGKAQVSSSLAKYETAFAKINEKYKELFATLSEKEEKEKKQNEYFLLGNKAMRNDDARTARKYFRALLKIGFSKKAFAYLLLSYTDYPLILKLRSKF